MHQWGVRKPRRIGEMEERLGDERGKPPRGLFEATKEAGRRYDPTKVAVTRLLHLALNREDKDTFIARRSHAPAAPGSGIVSG